MIRSPQIEPRCRISLVIIGQERIFHVVVYLLFKHSKRVMARESHLDGNRCWCGTIMLIKMVINHHCWTHTHTHTHVNDISLSLSLLRKLPPKLHDVLSPYLLPNESSCESSSKAGVSNNYFICIYKNYSSNNKKRKTSFT